MEFLERIERSYRAEIWRVRIDGAIGTAHVFDDEDHEYNAQVARGTRAWLGFRHPRVVPVLSVSEVTPRFVIATGDDRGPSITRAAKQLADAGIDREAWAVGEIIALADAIAAMARDAGGDVEDRRARSFREDGLHRQPFVHRRANPEQIVIGVDGRARFRAPIEHVSVGVVPAYLGRGRGLITGFAWMSPEQVRGHRLGPASDVFQLATTLYTLLTGERLARGNGDYELLRSIIDRTEAPAISTRTPGLEAVVQRGLAIKPDERYCDPAEFARALRALPAGEPSPAAFDIASRQPHPPPSRSAPIASSRCQMAWEQLAPTTTDGVRYCSTCKHDVVRVSSALALVPLLGRRCVAFQSDDN